MFPVLETDRLILREITMEDTEGIFACFSNEDLTRYYGQEPIESIDQAKSFVELFSNNYHAKRGIRWGIERKEAKGIIGTIGYHAWAPNHKRAEIGYEIHPEHWRRGYLSEAIAKVILYGFQEMKLERIGAIVFTENEASNKLLTKMGFQQEGVLRNYMYQGGHAHDTYIYSLLKNES